MPPPFPFPPPVYRCIQIYGDPMKIILSIAFLYLSSTVFGAAYSPVQEILTPNNIKIWLVENPDTPVVAISYAFTNSGGVTDPEDKVGLNSVFSDMLNEGAGHMDDQQFQNALKNLGTTMVFESKKETFQGSVITLKKNIKPSLDLLHLALTKPTFPQKSLDRIKQIAIANLEAQKTKPSVMGQKALFREIFQEQPYGRFATPKSIGSITKKDLSNSLKKTLSLQNLKVVVVGNVTSSEISHLIDHVFKGIPQQPNKSSTIPSKPQYSGKTIHVEADIPQSIGLWVSKGLTWSEPKFLEAHILNYVLGDGGNMTSRLFKSVREERGLCYSISTDLGPTENFGMIIGNVASDTGKIAESFSLISEEWKHLREKGLTQGELDRAKTSIIGSLAVSITSSSKMANLLLGYRLAGYKSNYLETRTDRINKVTLESVNKLAKELFVPNAITKVIVGRKYPKS